VGQGKIWTERGIKRGVCSLRQLQIVKEKNTQQREDMERKKEGERETGREKHTIER
jgi:hypothetical protein